MGKPKDYGKTKSLNELLDSEERRLRNQRRMPVRRGKQGNTVSERRQRSSFPFTPARPDRPNALGLNLNKWDCRIANGVSMHGFLPVVEFCKLVKVPVRIFYQRLRDNPDLIEALKLLGHGSRVLGYAKAMTTLSEKFRESPKWAELYLKVNGLLDEPTLRMVKEEGLVEDRETIKARLKAFLLTYKGGNDNEGT